MHFFYTPDIQTTNILPEIEAQHCIRVLRMKEGDTVQLTDGNGYFYEAVITLANPRNCQVEIIKSIREVLPWQNRIEIAVAPTKNIDRMEWLVEKTVETGIDKISFLHCRFSERKDIKLSRIEKIAVSAMKQSLKATLPALKDLTGFKDYISGDFAGSQKFIAHCYPEDKTLLSRAYTPGRDAVVLIGPEGDFSEEEVRLSIANGFQPVSLGESRLRTETAALLACQTIHIVNHLNPAGS